MTLNSVILEACLSDDPETRKPALQVVLSSVDHPDDDSKARAVIEQLWTMSGEARRKEIAIRAIQEQIRAVPQPSQFAVNTNEVYRGCGTHPQVALTEGFRAQGKSTSIWEHKRSTGISIYVSASRSREIAAEHAMQHGQGGFIYAIDPAEGVDCASWFAPLREFFSMEEEVVFPYRIQPSAILAFAHTSQPNLFYPVAT